jgi:hypothetical protein
MLLLVRVIVLRMQWHHFLAALDAAADAAAASAAASLAHHATLWVTASSRVFISCTDVSSIFVFFCFFFLFQRAGLRRDEGSMEVEWGCIYRETERAAQ